MPAAVAADRRRQASEEAAYERGAGVMPGHREAARCLAVGTCRRCLLLGASGRHVCMRELMSGNSRARGAQRAAERSKR